MHSPNLEQERDHAWATCKKALTKVDNLRIRVEHAETQRDTLLELLQNAQYYVPAGLLRDRIDATLRSCE